MMKTLTITTSPQTPPGLMRTLARLPEATVRPGDSLTLTPPGGATIEFLELGQDDVVQTAGRARLTPDAKQRTGGRRPVVYAGRMSADLRRQLTEAGISHADGSGRALIVADGLYIALDAPARPAAPSGSDTLGHVGLRAAQVLVDHRVEVWSTAELATRAGVSLGQAHKVLHSLEQQQLVEAPGARNRRDRRVVDRGELLDWISTHRRVREPTDAVLLGYVPARDSAGIATHLAKHSGAAPFVVTGIAAAAIYGHPVTTSIPVTTIRVDAGAGHAFADAVRDLAIEVVERAPNVRVIRDTGKVGTFDHRVVDGTMVAPPSRTYLDMLTEGRGEDAADLFRTTALELAR